MNLLFALLLAGAGFTALALAMDRHHRQVRQCTPSKPQRLLLRTLGCIGLTTALVLNIAEAGWGVGLVTWLGLITVAAIPLVLTLAYWQDKPRKI